MDTDKAEIRFGTCADGLYLAIDGAATRRVCAAAGRLVSDYLAANPQAPGILLDLGSAAWVDSTFAGWILQLRQQVGTLSGGSLCLADCSPDCWTSLDNMRLTALLNRRDVARPAKLSAVACPEGQLSDHAMLELITRAHEELAALDEDHRRVFGPIATRLRSELEQQGHRPPGST